MRESHFILGNLRGLFEKIQNEYEFNRLIELVENADLLNSPIQFYALKSAMLGGLERSEVEEYWKKVRKLKECAE